MAEQVILYLNSMILEVDGLKDVIDDSFLNSATVTATLVDKDDIEVAGQVWPLTLDYVSASEGIYRGTIEEDIVVNVNDVYTAQISADGGAGLKGHWDFPVVVKRRKFT